jgi:peptide/nickel transport system substrate-binding protein
VRFHDGTPFTADDAVFSIERAQATTSDFQRRVDGIAAAHAIDDHTVRVTTTVPDPSMWLKLADIAIMSEAWARAHEVADPADFVGARAEIYASRHANGTGPFVLESFEPRGGWVLVRNPDWWGAADYPHDIDRVVHVQKDDPEDVAALMNGEIDLLQTVPYWALEQIRSNPDLQLAYRTKLHTIFLGLDLGSPELRTSNVKRCNPFTDKRVRQAMAHAMDMGPILTPLMRELFIPAGMIVAPGVNGYAPDLDQPPAFDPEEREACWSKPGTRTASA